MEIFYKLASSEEEKGIARILVESQYRASGYLGSGETLRHKLLCYEDVTYTFIAWCKDKPLATLSVVMDSSAKLPLEELYGKEIDMLRRRGQKLVEVTRLASDEEMASRSLPNVPKRKVSMIIIPLFQIALHFAANKGMDTVCIAINPKHELLYEAIGFRDIGDLRYYQSLHQAPTKAKILNLHDFFQDGSFVKKSFLVKSLKKPVYCDILEGKSVLSVSLT